MAATDELSPPVGLSTWNDASGLAFAAIARTSPVVIMLVGISGSGKTTLAHRLAEGRPDLEIVSYDAIQHELDGSDPTLPGWAPNVTDRAVELALARIETRCAAGLSSIADATHRQETRRRELVRDLRKLHLMQGRGGRREPELREV